MGPPVTTRQETAGQQLKPRRLASRAPGSLHMLLGQGRPDWVIGSWAGGTGRAARSTCRSTEAAGQARRGVTPGPVGLAPVPLRLGHGRSGAVGTWLLVEGCPRYAELGREDLGEDPVEVGGQATVAPRPPERRYHRDDGDRGVQRDQQHARHDEDTYDDSEHVDHDFTLRGRRARGNPGTTVGRGGIPRGAARWDHAAPAWSHVGIRGPAGPDWPAWSSHALAATRPVRSSASR